MMAAYRISLTAEDTASTVMELTDEEAALIRRVADALNDDVPYSGRLGIEPV